VGPVGDTGGQGQDHADRCDQGGHGDRGVFAGRAGAIQRGATTDDYPCDNNGNDCATIFAVSIAGVTPSRFITWFQAQQAAINSGKRLLTNAEWQGAAAGTPDPGTDNGTTDCNVGSTFAVVDTGSHSNCVSRFGVFDMVGNLWEWVADWVPPFSGSCGSALFAGDFNCLAGTTQAAGTGALFRGGDFNDGTNAGVFAVDGFNKPSDALSSIGFRCGR
jgi:formylglycine-generating enzyme required for sulfatase activity